METQATFEFGPFSLDISTHSLQRHGQDLSLPAKAIDLLCVLVANRDRVVEKDELLKRVWPDAFVEENNLSVHISALRKALGEFAPGTSFIETIPRRGYRFVAPVTELQHTGTVDTPAPESVFQPGELVAERTRTTVEVIQESRRMIWPWLLGATLLVLLALGLWRTQHPPSPKIESLAVLPFKGPAGPDELGFGIADALITRLAEPGKTLVRPTQAVRKFDTPGHDPLEAGRQLKVDAILDGTLQRDSDRIRLTVQLLRVSDGKHLWGHTFDHASDGLFALEDSLARQLSDAIDLQLSTDWLARITRRGTTDLEAHRLALAAHRQFFTFTTPGLKKAIELADQAIARDPNYAMAHFVRAISYQNLPYRSAMTPREAMPKAKESALRTLQLDPDLPYGHVAVSFISLLYDYDPPASERAWRRALELDPNESGGYEAKRLYCTAMGRREEAVDAAKKIVELVPTEPATWNFAGNALFFTGRYEEALDFTRKALEIDPRFSIATNQISTIRRLMGQYPESVAAFLQYRLATGADPAASQELQAAFDRGGIRAFDEKRLQQLLEAIRQGRFVAAYPVAVLYNQLGEKNKALDWLDKAYEERDPQIMLISAFPGWKSLRGDSRFEKLRSRLGLP